MNFLKKHLKYTKIYYYIISTSWWEKRIIKKKGAVKYQIAQVLLNSAPIYISKEIKSSKTKPILGIVKDIPSFDGYVNPRASWLRYERFVKNNDIPFKFIDILKSDWIEQCKSVDIVIWHTPSSPSMQNIAESKIYIIEKILNKLCFPSFDEIWQYEDKIRANYLYQTKNIPTIPTIITNSKNEAIELINKTKYPFISKIKTGSSSNGVKKIKNRKKALKDINKIFTTGLSNYWKYIKQKDYFYIQKFIDDAKYDLRIMIVANKAFGYYRLPKKGDFKASGSGNIIKKEIPIEALKIAIETKKKLNSRLLGIDLLYSEKDKQYYIIETSLFNQIDTPEQLVINNVSGYYDISDINNIQFKKGKLWIQELLIESVIKYWINQKK